jgi:predicted TIM-barrel fold metal-dependent hydrolase
MGTRSVVITTDSHVGRPQIDFTEYFAAKYRDDYAEQRKTVVEMMEALNSGADGNPLMMSMGGGTFMDPGAIAAQQKRRAAKLDEIGVEGFVEGEFMMIAGDSDPGTRLKELEADGTSGAILFPQGSAFGLFGRPADDDFYWEGHRAHNRWMSDFVSGEPERWAATIQLDLADIDRCVSEVRWGREHGLRGGVFWSGNSPAGLPRYNDDRYEPLWSVLEELDVPFVMHAAFPSEGLDAVFDPGKGGLAMAKLGVYDHINKGGPLSSFIFGRVFERHPGLKVVVAETGGADWVLYAMEVYDDIHAAGPDARTPSIKPIEPIWDSQRPALRSLPRRPSEYLGDNVWVQTHCHHRDWARIREIGTANVVWGSDFPHAESTWPESMTYLQEIKDKFGLGRHEMDQILAHNPAKIFGFDLSALQTVADRIGPDFNDESPQQ